MAATITHSKVSSIPDGADTTLVRPSDWNASHAISGTLDIANGGTGASTATAAFDALSPTTTLGDTIYHNGADNVRLAGNTTTTKQFLSQTGNGAASAAPSWSAVSKSDVGLANVENTALSTWAGSSNITTVGTVATGNVTNLTGGNGTTLLGSIPYQSGTNLTTMLGPNTTTTKKFLRQTGSGTNGAAPAWDTVTATDVGLGNVTNNAQVTSVSGTSPVASSGGTTPAISLSSGYGDTQNPYASKTANYVLAAPNGSAGVPTFRAIVAADIPTLNQNTSGSAGSVANAVTFNNSGTGAASGTTYNGSAAQTISYNTIGAYAASNPSGYTSNTGTVTSVGGTGTVSGLSLSGTVTTSGNLTLGGTLSVTPSNFASQTANTFLAAPNGTAGTPTFRAIVAADVPTLNQNTTGTASNVTGTVAVANGGTGVATLTGIVKASGTSAFTAATAGTDYVTPTGSETLTNKTLTDPIITGAILEDVYTITDGAAFEIDPGNGTIQLITLGASRTPKATNFAAGESVTLMVNDGTAYTITWTDTTFGTSGVTWVGGTAPTLAATGYTVIELWKVGSQVYGALVGSVA